MSGGPAWVAEGEGPVTFALVAGLGDPKEAWARVVPVLTRSGARVMTVDNPGVGAAAGAGAPATIAEMAEIVGRAIGDLASGAVHLVGHSMGGMIAQEIAVARPDTVESLTLCCTYAEAGAYCSRLVACWRAVTRALGVAEARRQILPWAFTPAYFLDRPEDIAAIDGILEEASPSEEVFLGQLDALDRHDARGRLGALGSRATVIAAESDILIPPDRTDLLADELPGGRRITVPGGHACFWEQPEPFGAALLEAAGA